MAEGDTDTVCVLDWLDDRLEQGEAEEVREGEGDPEEQREAEGEREAVGQEVGLGLGLEDFVALGEREGMVETLELLVPDTETEGDLEKLGEVEERRDTVPPTPSPPTVVGVDAAERVGVMDGEGVVERVTLGEALDLGEWEALGDTLGEAEGEGLWVGVLESSEKEGVYQMEEVPPTPALTLATEAVGEVLGVTVMEGEAEGEENEVGDQAPDLVAMWLPDTVLVMDKEGDTVEAMDAVPPAKLAEGLLE